MLKSYPTINILGIDILAIKKDAIFDEIIRRLHSKKKCYVCLINVYSSVLFYENEEFRNAILAADFLIADGLPLIWVSCMKGQKIGRIRGTDLMLTLCQLSHKHLFSHYFYGGEPGIPEKVEAELKKKFPWLNVVGRFSPPFRPLTQYEDEAIVTSINSSKPDILWVALGNPKQEIWMLENRKKLDVPMIIGVGAAFDFLSGNVKQAPKWIQSVGLEWFFRLIQEPRRLWKRYIWYNTKFLALLLLDFLRLPRKNPAQK